MRRRHPLLLATALVLAGAAPAAAAEVQVNAVELPTRDTPAWDKTAVAIMPGDTVVWRFDGTTGLHNVMSSGAGWTYRTLPGSPAPPGSFTFDTPGTYTYICELHEAQMTGTVTVGNPPPPPPGMVPFPNDSTPPAVLETGGLDEERPTLGGVRVRVRRAGGAVQLRFRVSEPSDVTIRFERGGRTVATRHVHAAGAYRMAIRASRTLRAGRYRVELRARDGAGNASRTRSASLTVR